MTPEKRLIELEQENILLKQQLKQRDELIVQLQQRLEALEKRMSKDNHNSHLPPSSDRFVRQPKSLRAKSDKKTGARRDTQERPCLRDRLWWGIVTST